MDFEIVDDGIVVKLDGSEFLEIVEDFIKKHEFDYKSFCEAGY